MPSLFDQKCIGPDLYEYRQYWDATTGTTKLRWELVEADSPQCWVPPPAPTTFHLSVFVPSWAAGGYVQPGSGDYPAYSTVKLTAYPLSGYKFTSWGGDASGTASTYNLYMNGNKNVEAYFEKVPVPAYKGSIIKKELEYDERRAAIPVY